jgi:hypothetical protein
VADLAEGEGSIIQREGEKKDAWSRGKGWSGVVEGFHLTDKFPPRPCNHLQSSIGQYWV